VDYLVLGICMGARAGTGVPHDDMSAAANLGALTCTSVNLAMRIIIGIDELSYEKKMATYHFVEGGLGWVSDGAGFASSACAVAKQPEASAVLTGLSLLSLYYGLLATGGEMAEKYMK
jgi:hypothetical protein